jgi:hypothetical protein
MNIHISVLASGYRRAFRMRRRSVAEWSAGFHTWGNSI